MYDGNRGLLERPLALGTLGWLNPLNGHVILLPLLVYALFTALRGVPIDLNRN